MTFRSSPYINFDSGVVLIPPMELLKARPSPRSLDDMRDLFECRVDVWQFGPAVEILKLMEGKKLSASAVWSHAAYTLLGAMFTYFEMIGKTLNPQSRPRGTASDDFNHGFCDVYPDFDSANGDRRDPALPMVVQFRDRVRNGLYHLGYTKGGLFIHNEPRTVVPHDFYVDSSGPVTLYRVNPHQMTRTIVQHFPSFMSRLRDPRPQFDELRDRFKRFFTEYHGLT